jgi:hypothetical protein
MCFVPETPGGLGPATDKAPELATGLLPAGELLALGIPAFEAGPDNVPLPLNKIVTGGIRLGAVVPPFEAGFLKAAEAAGGLGAAALRDSLPPEGLKNLEPCL